MEQGIIRVLSSKVCAFDTLWRTWCRRKFFSGFYAVDDAKGKTFEMTIKDVLLRVQLRISLLRGQTYDGTANMVGIYNGAQALIRQDQPFAVYVHCLSHCVNLATEAALPESSVIRDALSLVNELGVISS